MEQKLFLVAIQGRPYESLTEVARALELSEKPLQTFPLHEAAYPAKAFSVGFGKSCTFLSGESLVDSIVSYPSLGPWDLKLCQAFPQAKILVFSLHHLQEHFSYALFSDGRKVRSYAEAKAGKVVFAHGEAGSIEKQAFLELSRNEVPETKTGSEELNESRGKKLFRALIQEISDFEPDEENRNFWELEMTTFAWKADFWSRVFA